MKVLDLFSGIGGFSLGLERAGMETVAFCEIDQFCQKVLKKHWPDVPIYNDVRNLNYDGHVDLICGGYPCQPFSVAGKRQGSEDDRHLWPAMFSLVKKHRPHWVIGENVAGHINMGIDNVLTDLEGEGYTVRTFVIPACAVNAPHRRDRVWIVGNAPKLQRNERGDKSKERRREVSELRAASGENYVAYSNNTRLQGRKKAGNKNCGRALGKQFIAGRSGVQGGSWAVEPAVGRVAHGVSGRVDRLKSLGNAVVPQIPEIIGRAIMEIEA